MKARVLSGRSYGARGVLAAGALALGFACGPERSSDMAPPREEIEALVRRHALAWERGDTALARQVLHERALLAHPTRRLDTEAWIAALADFAASHVDTRVYVHRILVDGAHFAVEWQFATTDAASGARSAVGDAIVGQVEDGRIVLWKEYLDGRVARLQHAGELPLDEGEEPFPWPRSR